VVWQLVGISGRPRLRDEFDWSDHLGAISPHREKFTNFTNGEAEHE